MLLMCVVGLRGVEMSDFFIRMPVEMNPLLGEAERKDLVSLYHAGSRAALRNALGGESVLESLTDDYMLLRPSSRSCLEIRFLPLMNGSQVACVVSSVSGPVEDSRLMFYSLDWSLLEVGKSWCRPLLCDFVPSGVYISDAVLGALSCLDMDMQRYSLSSVSNSLTVYYTTPFYLSVEDRAGVKPYLRDSLVYDWCSGRYELCVE
jgi:hypothetical protein